MKRRYKNPPIQEAVCEIHFDLENPWNLKDLQKVGEFWKASYPNQQTIAERRIEVEVPIGDPIVKETSTGAQRIIARSKSGQKIAQISSTFLAVNQLHPYQGWNESFRADILGRLEEIKERFAPETIKEINLRYIDRVDIPQQEPTWKEWFTVFPDLPGCISSKGGNFQLRFEQTLTDGLSAILTIGNFPEEIKGTTSVLLDTVVFWRGSKTISECEHILDLSHKPHNSIFNELLTPLTQELLGVYDSV